MTVLIFALQPLFRGMAGEPTKFSGHAVFGPLEPVAISVERFAHHLNRAGIQHEEIMPPIRLAIRRTRHGRIAPTLNNGAVDV